MSGKNSKTRNTIQTQLRPGPNTATTSSSEPLAPAEAVSPHANPDITALKLDLLASLRKDIADIFKKELQDTLGEILSTIKLDLQAVKSQLANDKAATDATLSKLKGTVVEIEHAITECSDDITEMKTTIECLTATVAKLENKCEDLEKRSVWLRSRLTPLNPGDRPRAIVCRFHYYGDCVDILRRARELRHIKIRDMAISVFPDHTAKIARARAAFNEVRRQLRGIIQRAFASHTTVLRRTLFQWRRPATTSRP
uniref:L1 transposable element RRM domain-containing protein n=1 Tax=Astyanax mexicanus TaxID=7994 RepID=A0A3B1J417_ASTMX